MTGTIAEVKLALDDFALKHTLTTVEGLQCDVERVVALDPETVMPFMWVTAPTLDALDETLEADGSIDQIELIADVDDERLYRMHWIQQIDFLIRVLVEEDGTILSASGNGDGWHLRLLFPDRESLSETNEYCRSHGIQIELRSVYNIEDGRQGRFGLTDAQQDALVTAYEHGYYDIPRGIDLDELATTFDVSHQALSERMRRAHRNIVENGIIIGPRDDDENR